MLDACELRSSNEAPITERVPSPKCLHDGGRIAERVREHSGVTVEPMQLAALLLERTTEQLSEEEAKVLVGSSRRPGR
jgi:hypothetical protein